MSEWVLLACSRGSKREFVLLFSWYLGQGFWRWVQADSQLIMGVLASFCIISMAFELFLHTKYVESTFNSQVFEDSYKKFQWNSQQIILLGTNSNANRFPTRTYKF